MLRNNEIYKFFSGDAELGLQAVNSVSKGFNVVDKLESLFVGFVGVFEIFFHLALKSFEFFVQIEEFLLQSSYSPYFFFKQKTAYEILA